MTYDVTPARPIFNKQKEDGDKIWRKIQQFRIVRQAWEDDGIGEPSTNVYPKMFEMRVLANEILEMVRVYIREYNIPYEPETN